MKISRLMLAALLPVLAATPATSASQIGSLRQKAEEARKKLEDKTKKPTADTGQAKGTDTTKAPTAGSPTAKSVPVATAPAQDSPKPDAKVWENYDFVPGSKVLFYTDFSEDKRRQLRPRTEIRQRARGRRRARRREDAAEHRRARSF